MDTFIADFIKALPNALATAVLTILLTGGLLFVFQEKIKNFFAMSLFEHQTKFARSYPKTLEVLETFIQKFHEYVDLCSQSAIRLGLPMVNRFFTESEMFELETNLSLSAHGLHDYIWRNRMYISDESFSELAEISGIIKQCEVIRTFIGHPSASEMTESTIMSLRKEARRLTGLPFNLKLKPNDKDHLRTLMEELIGQIMTLNERMDKLYKSVAETQ